MLQRLSFATGKKEEEENSKPNGVIIVIAGEEQKCVKAHSQEE